MVDRQVDDLAARADGVGDPAQCRPFVPSPEPEVEDDVGAQLGGPHAQLDQLAFDKVPLVRRVLAVEQRDLPLVRRQPQRRRADLQLLRARGLPCAGKADDQVDDGSADARISRIGMPGCVHGCGS
jgi:hypothetical protein